MQLLANNAHAQLAANILATDTSLTVEAGKADLFPIGTTGDWLEPLDWFKITLEDDSGNIEILHAGVRGAGSGVISNLLRGQEGTTARAFAAGTTIAEVRYTKADAEAGVNALLTSLQKTGGALTGPLILFNDAEQPMQPATKRQLDAVDNAQTEALVAAVSALTLAVATAQAAAVANKFAVGAIEDFDRFSVPAGWVKSNGRTIGNAASGATGRANADTEELFTLWWTDYDNSVCPIQNNAGAASTRGASAAADFAAGKRLPTKDLRSEFRRGLDDGRGVDVSRVVRSNQASEIEAHSHEQMAFDGVYGTGGGQRNILGTGEPSGTFTRAYGSTETRPRNVAFMVCVKL